MMFAKGSKWIAVAGVVLLAVVVADSLVPVTLQVRLGLHWLIEHFLAYFALTLLFCLAWPRPFVVAVALMAIASAIEALARADCRPHPGPCHGLLRGCRRAGGGASRKRYYRCAAEGTRSRRLRLACVRLAFRPLARFPEICSILEP